MVYFGDIVSLTEGLFLLCFSDFIRNYVLLGMFVLLQRVRIQSANADFIPPRGGAQRDRDGLCGALLYLSGTSPLFPGESAAAGNSVLAFRFTMGDCELFVSCSFVVAVSILAVKAVKMHADFGLDR